VPSDENPKKLLSCGIDCAVKETAAIRTNNIRKNGEVIFRLLWIFIIGEILFASEIIGYKILGRYVKCKDAISFSDSSIFILSKAVEKVLP